ncbi:MAG: YybH family protein [Salibacteraceae bacterium]
MKHLLVFTAIALIVGSCDIKPFSKIENNNELIHELLFKQRDNWNKGDLDGFMGYYWKNDSLCFLGKNGMNCGWENIYSNYKKSYSSKEQMGHLEFEILKSEPLTNQSHFLVGSWKVMRVTDTIGGSFNLIWKEINGEWKIVFDHTS